MTDLLVSIILAVCPMPDNVETTECHEKIVNCAVKKDGSIDEQSIQKCITERREREDG